MRRKDSAPAMTINSVTTRTRKRWRSANWTMRWIIVVSFKPRLRLVLQRILELQKETAITDNAFAFLQAGSNLCASPMAVAELDNTASEFTLFRGGLNIDERLVFGVPKNGSIWNSESIHD